MTPIRSVSTISRTYDAIQEATGLPDAVAGIVAGFFAYPETAEPLQLDGAGNLTDSQKNRDLENLMLAAFSDPESPRKLINNIFEVNGERGAKAINQIMCKVIADGGTLSLDRTKLSFPNFTGIDFFKVVSAKGAFFSDATLFVTYEEGTDGRFFSPKTLNEVTMLYKNLTGLGMTRPTIMYPSKW